MGLSDPARFRITASDEEATSFSIADDSRRTKFSHPLTSTLPKLYVITVKTNPAPMYVGITTQSMRSRLRLGFSADGKGGYYGYEWRHEHKDVFSGRLV